MRQDMCTLRAAPLSPLAAAAPVPPQPVAGICLAQRRQGDRRRYGEGRGGGARRRCASSSGGRRRGNGRGWGAARRRAAFRRKVVKCYIPCVIWPLLPPTWYTILFAIQPTSGATLKPESVAISGNASARRTAVDLRTEELCWRCLQLCGLLCPTFVPYNAEAHL